MKRKLLIIAAVCALFAASCTASQSPKPTGDVNKDTKSVHQLVVEGKYSEAKKFLQDADAYYQGVTGEAQLASIIEYGVGEENLYKVMNAD